MFACKDKLVPYCAMLLHDNFTKRYSALLKKQSWYKVK